MRYTKEMIALLNVIVETKGNPTNKDVENCGFGFEAFLMLGQRNSHVLYRNALKMLEEANS